MWKYLVVQISTNIADAQQTINSYGAKGWELAQVASARYVVFKRLEYSWFAIGPNVVKRVLGTTGAAGDLLSSIVITPWRSQEADEVLLYDGSGSGIRIFAGNGSTNNPPPPQTIPLNIRSKSGPWSITTGRGVDLIATGQFT